MTNEQINATIAEVCGWTNLEPCTCKRTTRGERPSGTHCKSHIPDYCNDLNAMHEAETYAGLDLQKYGYALRDSITPSQFLDYCTDYIWHCSARQRAEAFLRTLGKWEEVQA